MPSQKNITQLDEVKQKVTRATAMFFVDYAGLTHQQLEEARRTLSENGSEIAIIKNTLMNLALQDKKIDAKEKLQGPHATLFAYGDGIATAKVLAAFNKKYGLPKINFGLFEGGLIDESMIMQLSKLPSKDILLAKLLGTLNAPISNFVYVLNANIVKLAQLLKAILEKKGQAAPIVADAAPVTTSDEPATDEKSAETPAETPAEPAAETTDSNPAETKDETTAEPTVEAAASAPVEETVEATDEANTDTDEAKGATSN